MPDIENDDDDRGLWATDDQAETARIAWTSLPEALDEASDIDRAARLMAQAIMLRTRNQQASNDPSAPIVILISPVWRRVGKALGWSFIPNIDDGSHPLSGGVFLCPPNLGASHKASLPSADLGAIFEWIEKQGDLGVMPALVLSPTATVPQLRLYEFGLSKPEVVRSYPIVLADLDLPSLDGVLRRFYEEVVCAPGGGRKCAPLWDNPDKFVPVTRPEKTIQNELFRFLRASLPHLRPVEEEDTPLGRLDIRLSGPVSSDETIVINHAVIELKVLDGGNKTPPFTDTQTIKDHVESGVRQAASYRRPPSASRFALLGCYDMRPHAGTRGESCFDHVRTFAANESVEIRRWPIFPNVAALRAHLVPSPLEDAEG